MAAAMYEEELRGQPGRRVVDIRSGSRERDGDFLAVSVDEHLVLLGVPLDPARQICTSRRENKELTGTGTQSR